MDLTQQTQSNTFICLINQSNTLHFFLDKYCAIQLRVHQIRKEPLKKPIYIHESITQ